MFLLSNTLKSLINALPEFSVSIPFGHMKGTKWIAKSANPGQAIGRYEPEQEKQFLALLNGVNVLWDVGAQVGWYSLLANKKLSYEASIYSFESHPKNLHF